MAMDTGNDGVAALETGGKPRPAGEPPAVGSNGNLRYRRDQDDRARVSPTGTLDASDPQVLLCVEGVYLLHSCPGTNRTAGIFSIKYAQI